MIKTLTLLLCFCIGHTTFAQIGSLADRQKALKDLVALKHIQPPILNDSFSAAFFTTFLKALDGDGLYLRASDFAALQPYRLTVDDDWNASNTSFFTKAASLYNSRLQAAMVMVNEITAKPFDFSLTETYNPDWSDKPAATDVELRKRWYLLLKYETCKQLMGTAAQFSSTKAINKSTVLAKEPVVRARVKAKYAKGLQEAIADGIAGNPELFAGYLNTFLLCTDPHSAFFDAAHRDDFKNSLNSEGLYFGINIDDNESGDVYIRNLAPGGPAWRSGLINTDDVLVKLQWEGEELVELDGMEAGEVSALLDKHTAKKLTITFRKANGQVLAVTLQKGRITNESNVVKSYVLAGEKKIGYVSLPSFYTSWEDETGSHCAADVAKEIVKLKKDSVQGLVLDLRFNGGGSVAEAVEMAGIFIDEGVVCQIRDKAGKVQVLKDVNRGAIWNGPLLVLVNGYSASASELLAAALQDYGRAIIAGTPTFGKATGQDILPIQEASPVSGHAKLTMIKLYRPTGKSAQKTGVQPDIVLPDAYGLEETEAAQPFVLPADTVAAYKYFKPGKPLALAAVKSNSTARVAAELRFKGPEGDSFDEAMYSNGLSLKWDDMEKMIKNHASKPSSPLASRQTTRYQVRNHRADEALNASSALNSDVNTFWLKRLATDAYVEESYNILSHFIQLQ